MENKGKINIKNQINDYVINFLSLFLIFYFFYGFTVGENSSGSGGLNGDFKLIWNNLELLKQNVISNLDSPEYTDSRPPLLYLIHIYLNPFNYNQEVFRLSVFCVSLLIPVLLFFTIKKNYAELENNKIILLSLMVTLSPYYRTSSFWGLSENYALIFLLSAYLILKKFEDNFKSSGQLLNTFSIFLLCLSSSLIVYFDQKLVIVSFIIFFTIIKLDIDKLYKYLSIIFYSIFAIPFLYLINLWGSIIPVDASAHRNVGFLADLFNPIYCLIIISIYILPFAICKKLDFKEIKKKFLYKEFFLLTSVLIIYLLIAIFFGNFESLSIDGKGAFYKLSLIVIEETPKRLLITSIFFILCICLNYFFFEKIYDLIILAYFLSISLFIKPFYQEYLDPLIYILLFSFLKTKLNINKYNIYIIFVYYFIFLISAKTYYNTL